MTSSNGSIFRVSGPLCGEFTNHRWIPRAKAATRRFDVFFDLCLNNRKLRDLWCHSANYDVNVMSAYYLYGWRCVIWDTNLCAIYLFRFFLFKWYTKDCSVFVVYDKKPHGTHMPYICHSINLTCCNARARIRPNASLNLDIEAVIQ